MPAVHTIPQKLVPVEPQQPSVIGLLSTLSPKNFGVDNFVLKVNEPAVHTIPQKPSSSKNSSTELNGLLSTLSPKNRNYTNAKVR